MVHDNEPVKNKVMKFLKERKQKKKSKYRKNAEKYYEEYMKKHGTPTELPEEEEIEFYGGGGYMKPKYKGGGMLGKKKNLDFNKDGKITKADFIMMAKAKMKRKGKK